MSKATENVINKSESQSIVHKNFNPDNSVERTNFRKKKLVQYSTVNRFSNDTTHNPLR